MLGGFEHHRVETFYFEVKYYRRSGGKLHITQVQGLDFKVPVPVSPAEIWICWLLFYSVLSVIWDSQSVLVQNIRQYNTMV